MLRLTQSLHPMKNLHNDWCVPAGSTPAQLLGSTPSTYSLGTAFQIPIEISVGQMTQITVTTTSVLETILALETALCDSSSLGYCSCGNNRRWPR